MSILGGNGKYIRTYTAKISKEIIIPNEGLEHMNSRCYYYKEVTKSVNLSEHTDY